MIQWTGLAPCEFEFPFPGSRTSTLRSIWGLTPTKSADVCQAWNIGKEGFECRERTGLGMSGKNTPLCAAIHDHHQLHLGRKLNLSRSMLFQALIFMSEIAFPSLSEASHASRELSDSVLFQREFWDRGGQTTETIYGNSID